MAADTSAPQPAKNWKTPPKSPPAGRTWQFVRDLPAPPELASVIEAACKERGFWRRRLREEIADQLKLQYHYGGKVVYLMYTQRGTVILAVGDNLDSPEIVGLRDSLTPEESAWVFLDGPRKWNDDTSYL